MKGQPTAFEPQPLKKITKAQLQEALPGQIIGNIMALVRQRFCSELPDKVWGQYFQFIRREVATWPAAFMLRRGFCVPGPRYLEIMVGIFNDIQIHQGTGRINYWPGYLQKCVQSHFEMNWETYYQEAKSSRALSDLALLGLGKVGTAHGSERQVEAIAAAHHAIKAVKQNKARKPEGDQLSLF